MTLQISDWLFHLEGGIIPPYCELHFLPFIGVNRLCISMVFDSSHTFLVLVLAFSIGKLDLCGK